MSNSVWLWNLLVFAGSAAALLIVRLVLRGPAGPRLRRMLREPVPLACLAIVALFLLFAIADLVELPGESGAARSLLDLAFSGTNVERSYSAPFAERALVGSLEDPNAEENQLRSFHLLGTDVNGYDVIYSVCKGSRTALLLVLGAMLVSFPLGLVLGILGGYAGGWIDDVVQWLYNTIASIPWLLFVIGFLVLFGRELVWIALAFGLTSWVELARLARGETLRLREESFVRAARALGTPVRRILARHILPNLAHVSIFSFTTTATSIVLAESVLTFIGIGVRPGSASWGRMLVEAQTELLRSPPIWWVFSGAAFLGVLPLVVSLNILGERLREILMPESYD